MAPVGPAGPAGTTVTANPATTTDTLTSIGIGTTNYAISGIVTPGTNGQLRAATAEDENRVAIDHSNLRVWHREVDTATPPTSSAFTNYQPPNYAGTTAFCPDLPGPHDTGDRCFSTHFRDWYRWTGSSWSTLSADPPNWRGARNNRDDAIAHITGTGQIVWWTGVAQPQLVTAFTPGTTTYRYTWEAQPDIKALQVSACPAPTAGNAGQVCQVNAAGDAYETGTAGDGVVTGGSVTGTTLTLTRSIGADINIAGLPTPGGTTTDGVVQSGTVSQGTLTLVRSQGAKT